MSESVADMGFILSRLDDLVQRMAGLNPTAWLSTEGAARYLGCSVRQVELLTDKGLLPYSRLDPTASKSCRRYHCRHLTAYLITGKNPTMYRLTSREKKEVEELLR